MAFIERSPPGRESIGIRPIKARPTRTRPPSGRPIRAAPPIPPTTPPPLVKEGLDVIPRFASSRHGFLSGSTVRRLGSKRGGGGYAFPATHPRPLQARDGRMGHSPIHPRPLSVGFGGTVIPTCPPKLSSLTARRNVFDSIVSTPVEKVTNVGVNP